MRTLLIADDSKTSQMLVQGALARMPDVEILTVGDGEAALELIRSRPVSLLITDINMPRLDGVGLVRAVRLIKPVEELPIVMITAKGDALAAEGLKLGANVLITKPISRAELVSAVEKLLGP